MSTSIFAEAVGKIVCGEMDVGDLLAAIEVLNRQGNRPLVFELYRIWLRHNPEHPLRCAVYFNYGTALSEVQDFAGAREALSEAIKSAPGFIPPYINLGNVCERLGALDEAVAHWTSTVNQLGQLTSENINFKLTALKQISRVFTQNRLDARAEETLRMSLDLNPHQHEIVQHWVAQRQLQCSWPVIEPWGPVTYQHLVANLSPLSAAALTDDPYYQLANAHHYGKLEVTNKGVAKIPPVARTDDGRDRRIRVGYVSSDLREHAVGFLMSEVFDLHDRAAIEVFAYYCGVPYEDATKARIRDTVEHWTDITPMSDEAAAARIAEDGIDILVDLNAYTKDGRLKLFAMGAAPVIANWLGYPGTTGSRHHHYIIADDRIIPPPLEQCYSEKVVRLPCYQPTDRKRRIVGEIPTRESAGLPEDAIVFCCFNGSQKISRPMFETWLRILAGVPGSVLWLLSAPENANERLLATARAHGIDEARIVFAPRKPNAEHLARYPLADLFLDTWPYGAHTTASDALWMGVPVVTLRGQGFASRVCSSLVAAAGLPELVCDTVDAYVELATKLASDKASLRELRTRLVDGRDTCVLFDTPLLVRSLEELYRGMMADYRAGRLPTPDLSNLELIHEIACEPGFMTLEAIDLARDHQAAYRAALIERSALTAARTDPRLQPQPAQQPAGNVKHLAAPRMQSQMDAMRAELQIASQVA